MTRWVPPTSGAVVMVGGALTAFVQATDAVFLSLAASLDIDGRTPLLGPPQLLVWLSVVSFLGAASAAVLTEAAPFRRRGRRVVPAVAAVAASALGCALVAVEWVLVTRSVDIVDVAWQGAPASVTLAASALLIRAVNRDPGATR